MMKKLLFILILFTCPIYLFSLNVGGHITEDTTWSPAYNPISVVGNIFIEEGVTLTILPGTRIELGSALLNNENYVNGAYFMLTGEESVAKMFWVNGRIIAEGTHQDSIIFTRDSDETYNHWGIIYFDDAAEKSIFKHCRFEYSSLICLNCFEEPKGALTGKVSELYVSQCTFRDNYQGIELDESNQLEISNNFFHMQDGINPDWLNGNYQFIKLTNSNGTSASVLFAGNNMPELNTIEISGFNIYMCHNQLSNMWLGAEYEGEFYIQHNVLVSDSFENVYYDNLISNYSVCYIDNNHFSTNDFAYCRINFAEGVISNNTFNDVRLTIDTPHNIDQPYFRNNYFCRHELTLYEDLICVNNVLDDCDFNIDLAEGADFYNCFINCSDSNLNYNNYNLFSNCALFGNIGWYNLLFQNCLTTNSIPSQNSAGGNIQISQQQIEDVYVDYHGHDFHLAPGSIAIDAGISTIGLDYPFDLDYRRRIWDGDGNGSAKIDIGPYEYGAPEFGTLECFTFSEVSYEAVDFVLVKVGNKPDNFVFSNEAGYGEIKLAAGIYDLQAERMSFENTFVDQIEIFEGQTTQIFIAMLESVDIDNNTISETPSNNILSNYPNPFNPTTTICFSLTTELTEDTELVIYNLKGQIIKALPVILCGSPRRSEAETGVEGSVIWNGTDQNSKPVSSGIYFARLKAGKTEASCKMLLLK